MEVKIQGKILKGVGGLYSVLVLDGSETLERGSEIKCRARGSFRHNNTSPLPGDTVLVLCEDPSRHAEEDGGNYVIDEIINRRNALIRPPMANLDYLFVTMAAASPAPILPTVDKLISIAEHNGIEPVIVITKRELDEDNAQRLHSLYSSCGFEVFSLSSVENIGVEPIDRFIKDKLPQKTAAFAGASGIGKSTLLNRLFPQLELSTSSISRKIERGRHTTREVTLFPLSADGSKGYIADTPGFSMLDFKRFDFFELDELFDTMREFRPYLGRCRYTKCSHTKEEGCAVLEAVRRGDIPASRHESYVELYDVLKTRKRWN